VPDHRDRAWRSYQLAFTAVLLLIILADVAIIAWRAACAPPPRTIASALAPQTLLLDPDTASPDALARVPGLSRRQIQAIIDYRQARLAQFPDRRCFTTLDDLDQVPHIGPKTLDKIKKHLHFPPSTEM